MSTRSSENVTSSHAMPGDENFSRNFETNTQAPTELELHLMASWNATQQAYARDTCIPQLVAEQAVRRPDAVALKMGEQELSYNALNQRANQLANRLQKLGVHANTLVGLCVERSLDMVVGLLAILKAGGAYVPLDPTYPPERLAFMIHDAQLSVLLTHTAIAIDAENTSIFCLDRERDTLAQESTENPLAVSKETDLAYVIYTSGSTGQPKGVKITHGSLLNLVYWHQQAFSLSSADRATQVTSPAFDATGWELWPYLTSGASVYLPDEDTRVVPLLLRDWLLHNSITISFLPTALAESLIVMNWPEETSLRFLLTGADTLHHYPPVTLPFAFVNNYGPTEATVVATSGRVSPTLQAETAPSIGRPIANTQIYILNEHLQHVPIGTPGELYIGGAGLAQGYLHRPQLTAERFISHPFSADPNARLYKTGDIARYLADGQIVFMGRTDHQVKIRGYRIELDEIIAALNEHPAVQTSIVVAREDTPDDKRLVAYIVLIEGIPVTASSLRETLAIHLPDYMLPTAFIPLETLPLTPNGKIDRAMLPPPDTTNTIRDDTFVAPSTPMEERVAPIVASLLNLEEIGVEDNFFMLGGHSLLGTQLIMRISDTFGVDLPLRALFDAPTVRELSDEIEQVILAKISNMSETDIQQLLKNE